MSKIFINSQSQLTIMANISDINPIVTDMFSVIATLINEVVTLITGDLLVLTIVGAFIALIVGIIYSVLNYVKSAVGSTTKMRK